MQVWWLFTIKTFDFFEYMQVLCTFGIKMLIFFEYMQVWCALVKIMHFLLLMQVLERYNSQNLQRVCNIKVNKAQIKTGFRFWCFVYFIFMKNKNHQNKINRMCIKHGNLQCFLSMSFNVFNTTLGSDTLPPSRGRPWGGATIYIYTYIFVFYMKYLGRPSGVLCLGLVFTSPTKGHPKNLTFTRHTSTLHAKEMLDCSRASVHWILRMSLSMFVQILDMLPQQNKSPWLPTLLKANIGSRKILILKNECFLGMISAKRVQRMKW